MQKSRKFFGTDGVRGKVNQEPITAALTMQLGLAAGHYFKSRDERRHSVVIGKDTRLSGYMLETALVAGFTSVGIDVYQFGPIPTPAVAQLTRSLRADLGVMITASHNPYHDNGIKLFGPDGYKLSDKAELEIEGLMSADGVDFLAEPSSLGRATRKDDAPARYVEIAKATFPRDMTLLGMRIVVDCANGASYKVAPSTFWELGAEVVDIHTSPDGFNINEECGALDTRSLAKKVLETRADIGIAFDGDADRLVIIDERGRVVDGDQLLGCLATEWRQRGSLSSHVIVSTVMANLMLEEYLEGIGLKLDRTAVGDRYVVESMRRLGSNMGGEQSGHIVMTDFATTGDALISALQILAIVRKSEKPCSEVCRVFDPLPQVMKNIKMLDGQRVLETDAVQAAISEGAGILGDRGRVLVRPSGTEPIIRIMAEGDTSLAESAIDIIASAISRAN